MAFFRDSLNIAEDGLKARIAADGSGLTVIVQPAKGNEKLKNVQCSIQTGCTQHKLLNDDIQGLNHWLQRLGMKRF